ncbi:12894_t:CDS:2 [Dentiscutata heterogama]|uniref:12894_t:CDS:1 n=1 Tax=Dentiscutata heterogama TaxID=1316150 RepID=A0ACA9KIV9_9GLOM|nr:12894_t:CDS:2 [Dentiscutata heterogama]
MNNFTIQVIDGIVKIYEEDLECLNRLESFERHRTVDSLTSDEDIEYDSAIHMKNVYF